MVRILYFIPESWPTFRADVRVLFGKSIAAHAIGVDLVAAQAEGAGDHEWLPGRWHSFPLRYRGSLRLAEAFFKHLAVLRGQSLRDYTAVQVRDMPLLASVLLLLCRLRGKKFYYWMSFPIPEGQVDLARKRGLSAGVAKFLLPLLSGLIGIVLIRLWVTKFSDHVFVQSQFMMDSLTARGVSPERVTPVPMGVDWAEIERRFGEDLHKSEEHADPSLVYLGTLDRARRIDVLFPMLRMVRETYPTARLVLVGDTHEEAHRNDLRRQAREEGVDECVLWTGWVDVREAWRYVSLADVALSPIPRGDLLDVSSPTKILEYFALGVLSVCNDNPDQSDIVRRSGSGLCVPYTAEAFASAVVTLIRLDSESKRRMRERGREFVKRVRSYPEIARQLAAVYQGLEG